MVFKLLDIFITVPKTIIWELFPIISTHYGILVSRAGWKAFIYFPHINEDRNKNEQFKSSNCLGSQSNFFHNFNYTSNTRNILLIKISIIQSKSLHSPQYPAPLPSLEVLTVISSLFTLWKFSCVLYTHTHIYKFYALYMILHAFFINASLRYGYVKIYWSTSSFLTAIYHLC